MKTKHYSVGFTYTVWVDVKALNKDEAVEMATKAEYDVPQHFELNGFDDPVIIEEKING